MQDYGLVSIITPSYNTAKFIGETIRSVQAQTYPNWEMIIVDDCSTDNTDEVVAEYRKVDDRIRYFKNEKNSGAAVSRNKALREAKGRWMAFLDSDDLWVPEKLEKQLKFMVENGYYFSYTGRTTIDEESKLLGQITTGPKVINRIGMFLYCWVGCLGVMYNSDKVGLIQIADLKKNNDYAIWLKVIRKAKCYLLKDNLAYYRVRQKSISHDKFSKLVKSHYDLYRIGEEMNPISSALLTILNLVFGVVKRVLYVKRID